MDPGGAGGSTDTRRPASGNSDPVRTALRYLRHLRGHRADPAVGDRPGHQRHPHRV